MERKFCTSCGSTSFPKVVTGGSFLIELVLWIFLIIPGVIYSIWRLTTRRKVCGVCGNKTIIPENSPMAQRLLHKKSM